MEISDLQGVVQQQPVWYNDDILSQANKHMEIDDLHITQAARHSLRMLRTPFRQPVTRYAQWEGSGALDDELHNFKASILRRNKQEQS